jgi:molybdopterin synthase catalytic subunit
MRVRVKLFGSLREAVGQKELSLDLPRGTPIATLRDRLAAEHAAFAAYGTRLAVSRNLEIARLDAVLQDGDEVAFLPPVSGGSGAAESTCTLASQPLDVGEVTRRVAGPGMGGVVVFIGAVRDHARGQSIRHLEYEAYPGMAEREMQKICDAAALRWPGARVAIAHREGHLQIGDLAVVVVAAAPHRAEAFDACRYAIDTLKQTVPIWKKEFAASGEYWVDDRP